MPEGTQVFIPAQLQAWGNHENGSFTPGGQSAMHSRTEAHLRASQSMFTLDACSCLILSL